MWTSAVWYPGLGWAKDIQRYNPELPILQRPALHILLKHVSHVITLAPGDGDSCGRQQLLAGAGRTGRVRGSSEKRVTSMGPGVPKGQGQPAVGSPGPGGGPGRRGRQTAKMLQQRGAVHAQDTGERTRRPPEPPGTRLT